MFFTSRYYIDIIEEICLVKFEWNEDKNKLNRQKHGIWFEEAESVFTDPNHIFFLDREHSDHEDRYIVIGYGSCNRLLIVVHAYSDVTEKIRIISVRKATKMERKYYEKRI